MFAQAFLLSRPWGLLAADDDGKPRIDLRGGTSAIVTAGCGLFVVANKNLKLTFNGRKQMPAQQEGGSFAWGSGQKNFWCLPSGSKLDERKFRLIIDGPGNTENIEIQVDDALVAPDKADDESSGGRQKRLLLALIEHIRTLVDDERHAVDYHAVGRKLVGASVPWEVAQEVWCRDASESKTPPLDIIVRHADSLHRTVETLANHPRRVLNRVRERLPIGRLEELDSACLEWYVRQPGGTAVEKAGTRQTLLGVTRHESHNTLENRVLRAYLRLAGAAASSYVALYSALRRSSLRVGKVERFGRICRSLDRELDALGISMPNPPISPNYVLQQDVNYRRIWQGYLELLRRQQDEDDIWRWQVRLWAEFARLSVIVALRNLGSAKVIAETPLIVRHDQQRGRWVDISAHPTIVCVPIEGRLVIATVIDGQTQEAAQFGGDNIWGYLWSIGPACVLHAQDVDSREETWVVIWAIHPVDGKELNLSLEVRAADRALSRLRERIRDEGGGNMRLRGVLMVSHSVLESEAIVESCNETIAYRSSVSALGLGDMISGLSDMLPVILGA